MSADVVTISVHERLDRPGYVVRVRLGDWLQKIPTATQEEAVELAESVKHFVELGLPVAALFGEDEVPGEESVETDGSSST